ncbi:MAG: carbohydrate-binding protein [Elusimicrobia bacterium]|nr:carbohydrate-binding protein [Elusimicrobiota bacterium]
MSRQKLLNINSMFIVCMFASSILSGVTDTTPPAKITYFVTAFPTSKSITLVWRSVGDDGNTGTATKYDIRYSLSPIITEAEWNSASKVNCDITPSPAGSAESFIVFGLIPTTKYYFAIKAGDEVPNWSPLSKSPSVTTPALTDITPPGKIIDLAITNQTPTSVTLTWTAPGNDDNSKGLASRYIPYDMDRKNPIPQSQLPYRSASRYIPYDIRYSFSPITDANWDSATKVKGTPTAQEMSKQETFTVVGLSPSTKYYFAIKTADEVPNWSSVSNSPSNTTKVIGVNVPYKGVPFQIPGKIELEDYDTGGEETSYHDTTTGNSGNAYRTTEAVDVETCSDAGGGYSVGWAVAGEWLKYTTTVKKTGTYTVEVRVAYGGTGGIFHIEFDDIDKTGPMAVPDTGGWQNWQTIKKTGVSLTAGKHVMKLALDTNGNEAIGNFNYINIISGGQPNITSDIISNDNSKISSSKNNQFFHEGAIFPNPNLAPINPPYIISGRGGPGEQPHETAIISSYKGATKLWYDEMTAKGKLPIPFTDCVRNDTSKSTDPWWLDTEEKMYTTYLKIAQEGYYGIEIDEWAAGDWDSRAQESINAVRRLKKQYPNIFIDADISGAFIDGIIAGGSDVIDLYMPEIYFYRSDSNRDYRTIIKEVVKSINSYGLEGKSMGLFSGGGEDTGTPPDVDLWIKYLRAESPQIAGFGLGIFKLYHLNTNERAKYDKVMDDNFFKLSPSVSITTPANNTLVNGIVKISVRATKNNETDNPVVSYRYFIDNKLIEISSSPEYSWNTTGYSKGKHIITVHAVATDYLAGVHQINVTLKSSP